MAKKVKWGVIGAGGIADRRTMPGMMLADNAELIAVMDVNADIIGSLKEKYHAKYAYTDADELIANPEIEAVYIATPVVFPRPSRPLRPRARGKHVLMEKPIAMTVEQGRQVIADIDAAGVKSACGFMMRYGALNMKIKEVIDRGVIGQVVSAKAPVYLLVSRHAKLLEAEEDPGRRRSVRRYGRALHRSYPAYPRHRGRQGVRADRHQDLQV